jgi:DNA-binding XRE family transcriptional regulator
MSTLKSYNLLMINKRTIGDWLFEKFQEYERKKGRRVTQSEFARSIDINQGTFSSWMNETRKPSAEAALKLAAQFDDYEILDLLDYPNPVGPPELSPNDFIIPVAELLKQFPESQRASVIGAIEDTLNQIINMKDQPVEKEVRILLIQNILSKLENIEVTG